LQFNSLYRYLKRTSYNKQNYLLFHKVHLFHTWRKMSGNTLNTLIGDTQSHGLYTVLFDTW